MDYLKNLLDIMSALRDPDTGCPWDLEQDFRSIAPYTIEEAYEVADAIDRENMADLQDELGDLLLQVVFHAQMASELGAFGFEDVAASIGEKMVRRHPHVFGDEKVGSAEAQREAWEAHKRRERAAVDNSSPQNDCAGTLTGIALALPALTRATKLGKRASGVGFDWPDADGVRAKIDEELSELDAARRSPDKAAVMEEIGDLLFSVANFARHIGADPEDCLRAANRKFTNRFTAMEDRITGEGRSWDAMTPPEMESAWEAVKASE